MTTRNSRATGDRPVVKPSIHKSESESNLQPLRTDHAPPDPSAGKADPVVNGDQSQQGLPQASSPIRVEHYVGSMYTELAKFGREPNKFGRELKRKYKQMSLADLSTPGELEEERLLGITPTIEEDKALSAIQILLSRTDNKGNLEPDHVRSGLFKWEGELPNLSFTLSEYLEAYGVKRAKNGRFNRAQRDRAIQALISLARKPKRIVYERTKWVDGKKKTDVIAVHSTVIQLIEGYEDLTSEEAQAVAAGPKLERTTKLVITASPLLVDHINTFYTIKPVNLHQEIEELVARKKGQKGRISRAYSLFVQWLMTKNHQEVKVSRDKLITVLLLETMVERRHKKEAYNLINESLEIAQELGYLLSYEEDALGKFTLRLNPARCSRVKATLEQPEPKEHQQARAA